MHEYCVTCDLQWAVACWASCK